MRVCVCGGEWGVRREDGRRRKQSSVRRQERQGGRKRVQGEGPQSFLRFRVRSVVTTASNAGMSRTSVESIGTVAVDCVGDKMIGHRLIVRPLDARPLLPRQILLIELKHHLPVGNPPGLREARRHWA